MAYCDIALTCQKDPLFTDLAALPKTFRHKMSILIGVPDTGSHSLLHVQCVYLGVVFITVEFGNYLHMPNAILTWSQIYFG